MMRNLLSLCCLAACLAAGDAAPAEMPVMAKPFASPVLEQWRTAITSPAYAKAGAHDPRFDDDTLWPKVCGEDGTPAYRQQSWPKARLLVWNTFIADEKAAQQTDFKDPANWLEDGRPATAGPDKDTDVLFPDRDQGYHFLTGHGNRQQSSWQSRHLTVGRNAKVYTMGWSVHGNLWIRAGGAPYFRHGGEFKGGKSHCFARCDNAPAWRPGLGRRPAGWDATAAPFTYQFTQYLHVMKPDGSMEIVGNLSTQDQFHVDAGLFIVAPDSYFGYGYRGNLHLPKEGTIQLQSGAAMSRLENIHERVDADLKGGVLRAGSPERPIRRDAIFGLSAKDRILETGDGYAWRYGLTIRNGSRLESHRVPVGTAALRIEWMGADHAQCPRQWRRINILGLPEGLAGVVFDDVLLGGLGTEGDPAAVRATWKDVRFGTRCASPHPEDLLSRDANPGMLLITPHDPRLPAKGLEATIACGLRSGYEIRYTLDGSDPQADSPRYDKSIRLTKPSLLRALIFLDGKPVTVEPWNAADKADYSKVIVAKAFVDAKPLAAVPVTAPAAGLALAKTADVPYREGLAAVLAAAERLKPDAVAATPEAARLGHEYLAVFSGLVRIDVDGLYGFRLDTSGLGLIEIDGQRIADWSVLPKQGHQGAILLAKGHHRIRVVANHRNSGGTNTWLRLTWNGPGIDGFQQIPADRLFH